MKGKTNKTIIAKIIIFICIACFAYSSYKIIKWKVNVDANAKIKEQLNNSIKIIKDEENSNLEYIIDFDTIKKRNSDAIAYIKVDDTNIDYIVVKGNNNDYYLNHNFDKKHNEAGWIFADYRNEFDGEDQNIILYGHNTRDGSMFGTLKNVLNKNWCESSKDQPIVLVTEKGRYYYQIFSSYLIESEDYYIDTFFKTYAEFNDFSSELRSRSIYDYHVEVERTDKILTLSSCTGDGKNRVVLHAKLIKNES